MCAMFVIRLFIDQCFVALRIDLHVHAFLQLYNFILHVLDFKFFVKFLANEIKEYAVQSF